MDQYTMLMQQLNNMTQQLQQMAAQNPNTAATPGMNAGATQQPGGTMPGAGGFTNSGWTDVNMGAPGGAFQPANPMMGGQQQQPMLALPAPTQANAAQSDPNWAQLNHNISMQLNNAVNQMQQSSFMNQVAAMAPAVMQQDPIFDAQPIAPNVPLTWGQFKQQGMQTSNMQPLMAYQQAYTQYQQNLQQQNTDNSGMMGTNARAGANVAQFGGRLVGNAGGSVVQSGTQVAGNGAAGQQGAAQQQNMDGNSPDLDAALAASLNGSPTAANEVMGMLNHSMTMGMGMGNTGGVNGAPGFGGQAQQMATQH